VFEYKGFYMLVNRAGIGKYLGKIIGLGETDLAVVAKTICELRLLFEERVDEHLKRIACA